MGSGDEDFAKGKILSTCPLGMGFLGKKVGEVADIKLPKGVERFEVIEIRYED